MNISGYHGDMDMTTPNTPAESNVCVPKMDMSLHWGTCEWILVRTWKADTTGKFVFSAILIALLAVAYEGLKFYRELLLYKAQKSRSKFMKQSDGTVVRTEEKRTLKQEIFNILHGSQTILHGIQIFISYILMLIVMLCNMNLIIAVCVGAAAGYFLFGWLRKVTCSDVNECCY